LQPIGLRDPELGRLAAEAGLTGARIQLRSLGPSGGAWAHDDGREIYPASLIKVPLAVATGFAIEAGRLQWDDAVTVHARNATFNDAPSPMVAGYRTTIEELVTLMLQRSDNVATNQLYDVLDRERATGDLRRLGFTKTAFRRKLTGRLPMIDDPAATGRNSFPPREAAELFVALACDGVPQAAVLRRVLATSWWDVKLSRGLEPGDAFAHKTGDTDEGSHDAGILTLAGGRRWVLVVYTELPSSDAHDERFGTFMRALRPRLSGGAPGGPANAAFNPLSLRSAE
jgi:beta-lactamase class A